MKKIFFVLICLVAFIGLSQELIPLKKVKPHKEYENILVKPYSSDANSSSFIIWVKKSVRLHKHQHHTENLYVISGKGELTLGDEILIIKKGDYINIPKDTPHALKVLSSKPIKVLSIQSPKFIGADRIYLDK